MWMLCRCAVWYPLASTVITQWTRRRIKKANTIFSTIFFFIRRRKNERTHNMNWIDQQQQRKKTSSIQTQSENDYDQRGKGHFVHKSASVSFKCRAHLFFFSFKMLLKFILNRFFFALPLSSFSFSLPSCSLVMASWLSLTRNHNDSAINSPQSWKLSKNDSMLNFNRFPRCDAF